MIQDNRTKKIILVLGDIFLLYLGLFIALTVRSLSFPSLYLLNLHLFPFFIINAILILIFYIAGFYDIEKQFFVKLTEIIKAVTSGGLIAILFFYLIPVLRITPKTNLIINIIVVSLLVWGWRNLFGKLLIRATKVKIFFLGESKEKWEMVNYIIQHPQIEYEIAKEISEARIIIVSREIKQSAETVRSLYQMIILGKTVIDFDKFYESLTGKIPVSTIGEDWFLENLIEINKKTFEKFKRVFDIVFSLLFFIPLLILFPFAALAIKINSAGPVLYRQLRVGKDGKNFELVKFRSMIFSSLSEENGWQKPREKNNYVTLVGNILRKTRLDELPQIWNILRGDISFVGPRPERPEFVEELKKVIPHYSIRHIIKPGLTGWGQIHFSDASAKDALKKMQYDLYYIKNRSPLLDTSIFLKTIMVILKTSGK